MIPLDVSITNNPLSKVVVALTVLIQIHDRTAVSPARVLVVSLCVYMFRIEDKCQDHAIASLRIEKGKKRDKRVTFKFI